MLDQDMAGKEAQVYKQFKVSEADVRKAAKKYAEDEDFAKIKARMQKVVDMLKPEPMPEDFTVIDPHAERQKKGKTVVRPALALSAPWIGWWTCPRISR
jgi:hypothetical protein